MKTPKIILLTVVTLLATLCIGVALAQPDTITLLAKPAAKDTNSLGGTSASPPANSTVISSLYPYTDPGYPNYSIPGIIPELLDAKDGTYTGLSMNTHNYITTIKADEITVDSNSLSLHVVNLNCVIDKEANIISVTASLIDYRQGTTSFNGKDVSFTTPYYEIIPMMGTETVPPQTSK